MSDLVAVGLSRDPPIVYFQVAIKHYFKINTKLKIGALQELLLKKYELRKTLFNRNFQIYIF